MIKIKRKIGPKGQIVLPKDIREQFNLKTGTDVVFLVEDQQIIIETPKEHREIIEEFCTLPENIKKRKVTSKQIKELIEVQYEERFKNSFKGKRFLFLPNLKFLDVNFDIIKKAQELVEDYNLNPRDAIHIATALIKGIHEIISDDPDLDKAKEIKRITISNF